MKKKTKLWTIGLTPILLLPAIAAACSPRNNKNNDSNTELNQLTISLFKTGAYIDQLMDERTYNGLNADDKEKLKSAATTLNNRYLTLLNQYKTNSLNETELNTLLNDVKDQLLGLSKKTSNSTVKTELEQTLTDLRAEVVNLRKQNATANEKAANLEEEKANLIKEHTDAINALNEQLKEAVDKAVDPNLVLLAKTETSAKIFLQNLQDFLFDDFLANLKSQYPEAYASNESLINKIYESFSATTPTLLKLTENYKNLFQFESMILNYVQRIALLMVYTTPENQTVNTTTTASNYMNMIFDWRINDLQRAIDAATAKEVNSFNGDDETAKQAAKNELLKKYSTLKNFYERIKTSSETLQKQISLFNIIEGEQYFGSMLSQDKKTFKDLPDVKLTPFPILQQITDEAFLKKALFEFTQTANMFTSFINEKGNKFIRSVKYDNLYKLFVKNVNELINLVRNKDQLKYFNDLVYEQDLDKLLRKAKDLYYQLVQIDVEDETQKYTTMVDEALMVTATENFNAWFRNNVINKRNSLDEEDSKRTYIWQPFAVLVNQEINRLRNWNPTDFTSAFARYNAFKLLERRVKLTYQLLNFYTLTNDDLNSPELKELLKYDLSAKIGKQITDSQNRIAEWKKQYNDINALVNSLFTVATNEQETDTPAYRLYVETQLNNATSMKNTLVEKTNSNGEWEYIFDDAEKAKLLELLNDVVNAWTSVNTNKENKELDTLKQETTAVQTAYNNLLNALNGNKNPTSVYGIFNAYIITNAFSDDENVKAYELLAEIKTTLDTFATQTFESKEAIQTLLNEWKTKANELKTKLEQSTEYEKAFNPYYDDFTLKNKLLTFATDLESKITAALEVYESASKEDLETRVNQILNTVKELRDNYGTPEENKTAPLWKTHLDFIADEETNLQSLERKKTKNAKLALFAPGQELYVLARYFKNNNLSNLESIMLPDRYQDVQLKTYLRDAFESVKSNEITQSIWSLDNSENSIEVDLENTDEANTKRTEVYNNIVSLENAYATSIIALLNAQKNNEDTQTALSDFNTKRTAYYTYLNGLRAENVYLTNKFARFSADIYKPFENSNEQGFTPFALIYNYATMVAANELMVELNSQFINPTSTTNEAQPTGEAANKETN
ncbi:hypothetical protein OF377_01610 [Ureaplasma sp. ES3154-GEN]|uniref:hypothetical protein n=1 Tax=Ureaplasma sp. ES3154-GEN TaxID=2984844 RepID=UPI0021E8527C|nr:hypothetical protein [Ureaplasma sp. ES3154-GEN]MCV3743583.1 hypothetical protein [Ureaplasma sp. ES3154-GEN]